MKIQWWVLMSCWLATVPAYGQNFHFLNNSPVRFFSEQDWEIFKRTGREVLEDVPEGETRDWENPESGHSGSIKALRSYQDAGGQTCRRVEIVNRAKGQIGRSRQTLCKQADGHWAFVQSSK
jgi:surface antigen